MFVVLVSFLLGIALSGIWFGLTFVINHFTIKFHCAKLSQFSIIIAAIIPTVIILHLKRNSFLNIQSVTQWYPWIVALLTAIITAVIVSQNGMKHLPNGKEVIWDGLNGVFMEVPQRLMMQTFIWYILEQYNIEYARYISIPITAAVWCISIVIQNLIFKSKFDISTIREIAASAFFSLCVGYIFSETMFIFFPMLAHFSERIIKTYIVKKRNSKTNETS